MSSLNSDSSKSQCLICLAVFQSEKCKNPEYFTTVFDVLCRLLETDLIEPIQWDFDQYGIPFCQYCCSVVEELKQLNDQFEILRQQIDHIFHLTKQSILKSAIASNSSVSPSKDVNLTLINRVHSLRNQFTRGASHLNSNDTNCEDVNPPNMEQFLKVKMESNGDDVQSSYANQIIVEPSIVKVEIIENDPLLEEAENEVHIGTGRANEADFSVIKTLNKYPDSLLLDQTGTDSSIQSSSTAECNTVTGSVVEDLNPTETLKYINIKYPLTPIVDVSNIKVEAELDTDNDIPLSFLERVNDSSEITDKSNENDPLDVKPDSSNGFNSDYVGGEECSSQDNAVGDLDSIFLDPDDASRIQASVSESNSSGQIEPEPSKKFNKKIPSDASDTKKHKCGICGKVYTERGSLAVHNRIHTGEKPFKCKNCDKAFRSSNSLTKHERIHSGLKPYKCETCGKAFTQSSGLVTHTRIHTGEKRHKCDMCVKYFPTRTQLENHRGLHHPELGLKPKSAHTCDTCGKVFSRADTLTVHVNIHRVDNTFKCEVCGRAFSCLNNLIVHRRVHTNDKPYKCKICSKEFSHSNTLVKHSRIHSGEKPYKCDICAKAFAQSSALVTHKRSHTGEKPFKCEVCDQSFTSSSYLLYHRKAVHSGESPYKCKICDKVFSRPHSLTMHQRKIHGDRPL